MEAGISNGAASSSAAILAGTPPVKEKIKITPDTLKAIENGAIPPAVIDLADANTDAVEKADTSGSVETLQELLRGAGSQSVFDEAVIVDVSDEAGSTQQVAQADPSVNTADTATRALGNTVDTEV